MESLPVLVQAISVCMACQFCLFSLTASSSPHSYGKYLVSIFCPYRGYLFCKTQTKQIHMPYVNYMCVNVVSFYCASLKKFTQSKCNFNVCDHRLVIMILNRAIVWQQCNSPPHTSSSGLLQKPKQGPNSEKKIHKLAFLCRFISYSLFSFTTMLVFCSYCASNY